MKITLDQLNTLFQLAFRYLDEKKIRRITFRGKNAYYPRIRANDMKQNGLGFMQCPPYGIGSLDDDINDVKYVLKDKPGFCSLHVEKLGAILSAVGASLEEGIDIQPNDGENYPELQLSELKLLFNILLGYLRGRNMSEISFAKTQDNYFMVPHKEVNFYDDKFLNCLPYVIGSATEDIKFLKKVVMGNNHLDAVCLQKLGALLMTIGETI